MPIATSKHSGVLTLFDKEFVLSGKLDKELSRSLRRMFDRRLECDYKDFSRPDISDGRTALKTARAFVQAVQAFLAPSPK